jgi:hypothetical protein
MAAPLLLSQQRRLALCRPVVAEARIEHDPIATAVERESAARPVDGNDGGAIAVVDASDEVVALDDDPVAHREHAAGQRQLLGAEPRPRASRRGRGRSARRRQRAGGRS